jgi:hypothetical protein
MKLLRRCFTIVTVCLVISVSTLVSPSTARAATPACASGSITAAGYGIVVGTFTFPAGSPVTVTATHSNPSLFVSISGTPFLGSIPGTGSASITGTSGSQVDVTISIGGMPSGTVAWSITGGNCGSGALLPLFSDGRQNHSDAGQTAAVYCGVPNPGDLRVYALYKEVGYLAFTVTKAQLAAGVQKPASPYMIKQGLGAQLWRLPSGDLQIRRGTYHFEWQKC